MSRPLLRHADCRDVLPTLADGSVAAIITDPPYGLSFMGRGWDRTVPVDVWAECVGVLAPGGYVLAFGGTRTVHRLACAIEDHGFEIRDQLVWLQSQGVPKSKAQLKPASEPLVLARKRARAPWLNIDSCRIEGARGSGHWRVAGGRNEVYSGITSGGSADRHPAGRWPANVIIDEHVADDLGDYARYFYCAKAAADERPKIDGKGWPTVKPVGLMRWLVRLVTPPGGLVLDPFAGTGPTLQAAELEGFDSIGIERDEFAHRLACQRLGLEDAVFAAETGSGEACGWSPTGAHEAGTGRDRDECRHCDGPVSR
jgi:DNA modification methylase